MAETHYNAVPRTPMRKREGGLLNKRPTLGLLTHGAGDPNSHMILSGVASVAQERDVNLICFPGKPLRSPYGFEAQSNVLYDLVDTASLDGLVIWVAGLTHRVDLDEVKVFCERYRPLPIVTIGGLVEGCPGVIVDNYHAMREVVIHLVEFHPHSRIAFIRGPEHHQEAEVRYRAYIDVLNERSIPVAPELIVVGNFRENGGVLAIEVLVDQRKAEFDALIAASDNMAIGAMKALQTRGIQIPGQVAIAGLNDESQSSVITPPLTTSPLRFHEQARRATEMVLALVQGNTVPERVILTANLLIRQSCGCPDPIVVQAIAEPIAIQAVSFETAFAMRRALVLSEMAQSMELQSTGLSLQLAEQLLDAFIGDLTGRSPDTFLATLTGAVQRTAAAGEIISKWHTAISILRRHILSYPNDHQILLKAENLWQQARVMIGETAQRFEAYRVLQAEQQAQTLGAINQALSATIELTELADVLVLALPQLNIASFYMSLYEDPEMPAGWSRLVVARNANGRINLEAVSPSFPSTQLVPNGVLPEDGPLRLVVEPLYFREDQLGFVLFEADPRNEEIYEILCGEISGALKRTLLATRNVELYHEAVRARQVAEEANNLKSRFLATVSHELRTPLSLIVGTIEMMLREETIGGTALPASYRRDLGSIRTSAQHLARLIGDVLDLASNQAGELRLACEPLDLDEALAEAILLGETLAREKGLAWRAEIPQHLPLVWGDRTRLQQVVLNLIGNATKFTDHGEVALTVEVSGKTVTVTVSDTGMGIPAEERAAIFDEFRQSERTAQRGYGGMGLGLAISRRLIELHGGQIGVESSGQEGSGSTFYFTLPIMEGAVAREGIAAGQDRAVWLLTEWMGSGARLRAHLMQRGFEVEELAIEDNPDWLTQAIASPPGAIVLDLEPAEERGWELMRLLKQHPTLHDVPVVFYSLSEERNVGSVLELDYLAKPMDSVELVRALERHGLRQGRHKGAQKILVVDDEPGMLDLHTRVIQSHLPDCQVFKALNGREALAMMEQARPDLVLLDLMMPEVNGFEVLEAMRDKEMTRDVPVIVLTAQTLTAQDMTRLQRGVTAVLEKGLFSTAEVLAQVEVALARSKHLGSEAQRVVRQAMAYIHEHYAESISREELARRVGVSERHLNRCFQQEMGMPTMTYLSRYRVKRAKALLEKGNQTVTEVAMVVGFSDSNYFSRVFRQEVGVSPGAYQRGERSTLA